MDGSRVGLHEPLLVNLVVHAGLATAAIGNGLALAALMYATLGLSGGHLNPAVSTAFVVTGRY